MSNEGELMPEGDGHFALAIDVTVVAKPLLWVTPEARAIVHDYMPEWLESFMEKNRKYRRAGHQLGSLGVIPDINRKTSILIDRVWVGNPTIGEDNNEVINDLIGHLFLLRYMLDAERQESPEWTGRPHDF